MLTDPWVRSTKRAGLSYDPAHPQVEIEMNGIKKRIEEIEAGWMDEQEKLRDLEIAIASF
jgi:hypothetical protein